MFNITYIYFLSLILNIVFFIFIYNLLKDFREYSFNHSRHKNAKNNKSRFFIYLRYLTFIITITNLVFIGTISIHEFGHFISSKYFDCKYSKIVFERDMPYTETLCLDSSSKAFFLISGIIFPFLIAGILYLVGGLFIRDISILIIGFNLIASYKDLRDLEISDNMILMVVIFGILFLFLGILLLAKSRVEKTDFFIHR
ncbi:MAG: hypothetical protein QXW97_00010 [Candidatus Pacearchaeota archaeon]